MASDSKAEFQRAEGFNMGSLEIKYRWVDVQSAVGYNYRYPDALSAYMKEKYRRPSVYRWNVWNPSRGFSALYVGETDNLARRIQQCLSPGKRQATNLRLKAYFDEALKRQERVEVQTLEFEPFQINETNFSMDLLGHTHIRQTLENLVLVWLHGDKNAEGLVILNRVFTKDRERREKRVESALVQLNKLGLTDEQTKRVIDALMIKKALA